MACSYWERLLALLSITDQLLRMGENKRMETITKPLSELVLDLGLKAKVLKANSKNKPEWAKQEWRILLSCDDRTMSYPYYGGGAANTPTLTDSAWVMGIEYLPSETTFNDFAADFGYDLDSLSAQNIFNEMMTRSRELEYLLGSVELATKLADSARDY